MRLEKCKLSILASLALCALIISYNGIDARRSSPSLNNARSVNKMRTGSLYAKLMSGETSIQRKKYKKTRVASIASDQSQGDVNEIPACPIPSQQNDDDAETNVDAPSEENEDFSEKMPTVFTTPRESKYDTYAACLAATEGLRRSRDAAISKIKSKTAVKKADSDSSWKSLLRLGAKSKNIEKVNEDEEEYKRACAQYVLQSTKAIHSLGMTVGQFNQIGKEVKSDEGLRQKIMEQAYLYRIAATINLEKVPMIEDPGSEQLLKNLKKRRIHMFAKSMTEIEELRSGQLNRLMKVLNIDRLPTGVSITDPSMLPILNPRVRAVVEAFPLQAEQIVKKYGLNSDEFNEMLTESRSNPNFRRKVQLLQKKESENKTSKKKK